MAGVKVDPPPLAVQVVDSKGYPTRALTEFLHRLWLRTGGNDDTGDYILKLMTSSGVKEEGRVESGVSNQTFELGNGVSVDQVGELIGAAVGLVKHHTENNHEAQAAIGALSVLMQAQQRQYASEISELRKEVESVKMLVSSSAFTPRYP